MELESFEREKSLSSTDNNEYNAEFRVLSPDFGLEIVLIVGNLYVLLILFYKKCEGTIIYSSMTLGFCFTLK